MCIRGIGSGRVGGRSMYSIIYSCDVCGWWGPKKWTVCNDLEDNDFKPIVDKVVELNESCFITGPAGTGKSQF